MKKIPKIKKELKKFVLDEEGTISKKSVLKAGIGLSAVTFLAHKVSAFHGAAYTHTNTLSVEPGSGNSGAKATHAHAVVHGQGYCSVG